MQNPVVWSRITPIQNPYTPENKHGTWKYPLGKGETSTNHQCLGSMFVPNLYTCSTPENDPRQKRLDPETWTDLLFLGLGELQKIPWKMFEISWLAFQVCTLRSWSIFPETNRTSQKCKNPKKKRIVFQSSNCQILCFGECTPTSQYAESSLQNPQGWKSGRSATEMNNANTSCGNWFF